MDLLSIAIAVFLVIVSVILLVKLIKSITKSILITLVLIAALYGMSYFRVWDMMGVSFSEVNIAGFFSSFFNQ